MLGFFLSLSLLANLVLLYLFWVAKSGQEWREKRAAMESSILRHALQANGRVNAMELAARLRLPYLEIEAMLREMMAHNQCLSELDRDGRAIYIFPQFDNSAQQQEATEREILLMAKLNGGELTAQQIAMRTTMSFDESQQWLLAMAERGACMSVSERNDRFRFDGLLRQ